MFFDQFYWLKVTVLLKKKPTCFQVGFLLFFRGMKIFNYMKNNDILKSISYKLYYVKWNQKTSNKIVIVLLFIE